MPAVLTPSEESQLLQTIEMFEVITQETPFDYQSLEILKEAYSKLGRQTDVVNTSKRIAQAYVQLGQLSSAILEYESILQRFPEDPDVLAALAEIESKANSFAAPVSGGESEAVPREVPTGDRSRFGDGPGTVAELDDGRLPMRKIFVDGKHIAPSDFDAFWPKPQVSPKGAVVDPFIQVLADRGIMPVEKSLRLLCDKTRMAYLPLDRYDVDVELARGFPRDACHRWCVLPFDKMSKSILVATTNPFNKQVVQELEAATRNRLLWYLTPPADLMRNLKKAFR
jgi:tetratricopeptide (TPR) repeat protein